MAPGLSDRGQEKRPRGPAVPQLFFELREPAPRILERRICPPDGSILLQRLRPGAQTFERQSQLVANTEALPAGGTSVGKGVAKHLYRLAQLPHRAVAHVDLSERFQMVGRILGGGPLELFDRRMKIARLLVRKPTLKQGLRLGPGDRHALQR